jgi:hypothetical protein
MAGDAVTDTAAGVEAAKAVPISAIATIKTAASQSGTTILATGRKPELPTDFREGQMRATMTARSGSKILALGIVACTVSSCTPVPIAVGGTPPSAVQASAGRSGSTCFYSNRVATDRIVMGRVLRWCGPEPRPMN